MEDQVKLLIVEDEYLAAKMLKMNLERFFGYHVCGMIARGEQAIEAVEAERPDVVLMDVRLAGRMDGIQAAREIILRYQIPTIVITGFSIHDLAPTLKDVGLAGCLEKPVGPVEVDRAIKAALARA